MDFRCTSEMQMPKQLAWRLERAVTMNLGDLDQYRHCHFRVKMRLRDGFLKTDLRYIST